MASALAHGPLASKRLTQLGDGRIAYALKQPWRDGTTAIVLTKRELMERIAAQIPRPREHLIRYAGVLAPNHPMRRRVSRDRESTREGEREQARAKRNQRVRDAIAGLPSHAALSTEPLPSAKWTWADLLKRVFKVDILECVRCGGRCKVIAVLSDPSDVQAFLASVGESGETPQAIRAPPWGDAVDLCDAP